MRHSASCHLNSADVISLETGGGSGNAGVSGRRGSAKREEPAAKPRPRRRRKFHSQTGDLCNS